MWNNVVGRRLYEYIVNKIVNIEIEVHFKYFPKHCSVCHYK